MSGITDLHYCAESKLLNVTCFSFIYRFYYSTAFFICYSLGKNALKKVKSDVFYMTNQRFCCIIAFKGGVFVINILLCDDDKSILEKVRSLICDLQKSYKIKFNIVPQGQGLPLAAFYIKFNSCFRPILEGAVIFPQKND